ELIVVAYGFTARSALRAVTLARAQGLKTGLLRLITIWPFDRDLFGGLSKKNVPFLVPEMNLGQVAELVKAVVGQDRVTSLTQVNGTTITPAKILAAIEEAV
ncbi:MAG: 2-oxoacid:acceptor oxidoreductase subunit alpha, partial [Alphaproteobacteria bacterium]|nr:2-oxoacid:acceptor oxidoreductase subunit alpha [Alphaproteobacteria bacterium]